MRETLIVCHLIQCPSTMHYTDIFHENIPVTGDARHTWSTPLAIKANLTAAACAMGAERGNGSNGTGTVGTIHPHPDRWAQTITTSSSYCLGICQDEKVRRHGVSRKLLFWTV